MEESNNTSYDVKDDIISSKEDDLSGNSKMKENMENIDLLTGIESVSFATSESEPMQPEDLGTRTVSTTRPLVTAVEEEKPSDDLFITSGDDNLLDQTADISDAYSATQTGSSFANESNDVPVPQPVGDKVSIDESLSGTPVVSESGSVRDPCLSTTVTSEENETVPVAEDLLPSVKDPKIGTKLVSETTGIKETGFGVSEPTAHSSTAEKSHSAMEAEGSGKTDGCCPFSPGVWFNPEKLHPCVAELVYWRDVKKSGIAFGSTLVLLLSLKYFSCISVAAYLTVAILGITMSFRIYKSILQAVQKSNEGHPFKEYLDMNINLSHEKLKDVSEVMIHHVNCVTNKIRSLVLVEDFFDTFKLLLFAWCMTYVGAWLNGMTVIILAFVSTFTLPKVYETNKTQIDAYTEVIRTKGKEVMEMVNAKIPLGKKKKEE